MTEYTIGQLAKQSDIAASTLRYYEHIGLIKEVRRSDNNYRYYPARTLNTVKFIKNAQAIGFSLQEIEDLLISQREHDQDCHNIVNLVSRKIQETDEQIKQLKEKKQRLQQLAVCCDGTSPATNCPILCELSSSP